VYSVLTMQTNTIFTVTNSELPELRFWDIPSGKCKHTLIGTSQIKDCLQSPDGKWIISHARSGNLEIFDSDGKLYYVLQNISTMCAGNNTFYIFDNFSNNLNVYEFKKLN